MSPLFLSNVLQVFVLLLCRHLAYHPTSSFYSVKPVKDFSRSFIFDILFAVVQILPLLVSITSSPSES